MSKVYVTVRVDTIWYKEIDLNEDYIRSVVNQTLLCDPTIEHWYIPTYEQVQEMLCTKGKQCTEQFEAVFYDILSSQLDELDEDAELYDSEVYESRYTFD